MRNREARLKLQTLYRCRCLLTGIKTDKLSYHHLLKKQHGGKATIDNGAQLIDEIHRWLHQLEHTDMELYDLVNECLDLYKQCIDKGLVDLTEQYETECMPEFREKVMR
jgi:hypothetical protein